MARPRKKRQQAEKPYAPQFENDPTTERVRQAGDVVDDFKTDSGRKTKRLNSILDLMLSRGIIDGHLYQAGMIAWKQWHLGGLAPAGAVDLSREKVDGGGGDPMQRRLDNAKRHQAAMGCLAMAHRRAYEVLVLNDIRPMVFGQQYYGYRDITAATAVAYAVLKDALAVLDLHYTGGKRPQNHRMRSDMALDARPVVTPIVDEVA